MDHSYFKDRVSAYYDQDLPVQELELMRRHITECEECQAMLAEFERLDKLIDQKSGLSETAVFWEESARKIEARLSEKIRPAAVTDIKRSGWSSLWWKAGSVAAAVLVVGFVAIHRFEILEDAGEPGGSQSTQPPAVQLEQKQDGRAEADTVAPVKQEITQSLESDRKRADRRNRQTEADIQTDAFEESPPLQKVKRREVQSLSAQSPAAEPAPLKTVPSGTSAESVEDQQVLEEEIAIPEKSKTALAPKKSADQTIKVRGGRAGEVEYVVDGVKEDELAEKVDKVDSVPVIKVQGEQSKETISRTAPQSELGEEVMEKGGKLISDSVLAAKLKVPDSAKTTKKGATEFSAGGVDVKGAMQMNSLAKKKPSESVDSSIVLSSKHSPDSVLTFEIEEDRRVGDRFAGGPNPPFWTDNHPVEFWRERLAQVESNGSSEEESLYCHYAICRLTDDKSEYQKSYDIIKAASDKLLKENPDRETPINRYIKALDSLNRFPE